VVASHDFDDGRSGCCSLLSSHEHAETQICLFRYPGSGSKSQPLSDTASTAVVAAFRV
jgi:hypothetical protein